MAVLQSFRALRPVQEKAAEQQLEDAMHEKPSLIMLLSAKQETSQTNTTASGCSRQRKSLATASSAECARREYVPGKSTRVSWQPCASHVPTALATVFPAQFPVCISSPVSSLNTVDFPTFALPASAITYLSPINNATPVTKDYDNFCLSYVTRVDFV